MAAMTAPLLDVFSTITGLKACVDLGGTKLAVTLANSSGLCAKRVEPTAKEGKNDALALQIIRMIGESCLEAGFKQLEIDAIGVSSCGPFVLNKGMVELAAPNICGGMAGKARGLPNDWQTALLETPLRAHFQHVRHLRVENDGIGALEAERRWGALQVNGKPMANCAYVTWSTGIGTGLCVDGHVLRGKNGNAGHAGHMFVSTNNDALCGCGNIGDLEGMVAGNAIPRRFSAQGFTDSATLFIAAKADNTQATAIIDKLCDDMGRALYNLIVTLDLERISIGGSVFWHHRDYLLPKLKAVIQGKLPSLTAGCELVPAGLGNQVGDWGALALVA
jgi:glucokinase